MNSEMFEVPREWLESLVKYAEQADKEVKEDLDFPIKVNQLIGFASSAKSILEFNAKV